MTVSVPSDGPAERRVAPAGPVTADPVTSPATDCARTRAAVPAATASVWNIANGLTALRFLLVPVFAVALVHDGGDSTGVAGHRVRRVRDRLADRPRRR